jgi:hypothetical protein
MVMITTLLTVACTFGVVAGFHAPLPSVVVRRRHTVVLRMAAAASSLPAVPVILHPDEYIDMKEALSAPLEVMLHSKRFAGLRYHAKEVPARLKVFFPKIVALFHPVDLAILGVSLLSYRHVLRFLYTVFGKFSKSSDTPVPYEQSLFARLQEPIFAAIKYVPPHTYRAVLPFPHAHLHVLALYCRQFDPVCVRGRHHRHRAAHLWLRVPHQRGPAPFTRHHLRELRRRHLHHPGASAWLDTPSRTFLPVGLTPCYHRGKQIKDWFLQKRRARALLARADTNATSTATATSGRKARDTLRERVVDELSTLAVWGAMGGLCLEAMSLEMGFALGSVFALGGLGSASAVLAMRDTMENVIGGLLLKFSDKLRIGELVTIPGSSKAGGKVIVFIII